MENIYYIYCRHCGVALKNSTSPYCQPCNIHLCSLALPNIMAMWMTGELERILVQGRHARPPRDEPFRGYDNEDALVWE